ncbi:MAG: hypothetical protein SCH98_10105 [Deferrisomatales bacterium]|nr:hypothetical protein [Deferrisomatales bacterium]
MGSADAFRIRVLLRAVVAGGLALFLPHVFAALAFAEAKIDLYAVEPEPMTVAECGRCHPSQFRNLKESGGGHRFDCRDCHRIYHAYNPRRGNYADLMPPCSNCHSAPHGDEQGDCLSCHENPHAPRLALAMQKLAEVCGDCHKEPAEQFRSFPSAHSQQDCQTCHRDRHGRIPDCSECHGPHFEGQVGSTCAECHPAHKPLETALPVGADPKTCAACHDKVFIKWLNTQSRHGQVNCAVCHARHRLKPECTACHQPPHDPRFTAKFKSCLGCHLDVHNLPAK